MRSSQRGFDRSLCLPRVSAGPDVTAEDLGGCCLSCTSVRLSGRVEQSEGSRRVGRVGVHEAGGGGGAANLHGHLARLTLFKQVRRRLVPCLVKWLTF